MMKPMDDEVVDLVDENDEVIGTINRKNYSDLMVNKKGYIRASQLFILNSKGELFTPIRTADKTIAPNGYDFAAAGHVVTGEDYLAGIIREAREELGMDLSQIELEVVMNVTSEAIRYKMRTFLLRQDDTPRLNSEDFVGGEWLTPGEVMRRIDEGHPAKYVLREALVLLLQYLNR
ncbi:MAG: NUDIX domain-containing protein [Candidatus Saccharimonadales bacterium]